MAKSGSETEKRGGLFDDLSFAQVAAGALAAVTSMLLASQIGIYGSVIGVGVGSIVSTVASQLYKKFLQRSADRLRELNPTGIVGPKAADGDGPAETAALPRAAHADDALRSGDSAVRRARVERERKRKIKRGVLVVSVASALVAVTVSAVAIDLASSGQGVGAKTEPLLPSRTQTAPTDAGTTGAQAGQDAPATSGEQAGSAKEGDAGAQDAGKDASKDQPGATDSNADAGSGDGSSKPADPNGGSGSEAQPNPDDGSASDGSGTDADAGPGSSSGSSSGDGTNADPGASSPASSA